jgi:hypothetical protein
MTGALQRHPPTRAQYLAAASGPRMAVLPSTARPGCLLSSPALPGDLYYAIITT